MMDQDGDIVMPETINAVNVDECHDFTKYEEKEEAHRVNPVEIETGVSQDEEHSFQHKEPVNPKAKVPLQEDQITNDEENLDEENFDEDSETPEGVDAIEVKKHHASNLDFDNNSDEFKAQSVKLNNTEESQREPSHITITSGEETVSPQPENIKRNVEYSSDAHEEIEGSEPSNRSARTPAPSLGLVPSMNESSVTKRILYSPIRAINAISSGVQKISSVANRFIEVMDVADTPEQTDADVGSVTPAVENEPTNDEEDKSMDYEGDESGDGSSSKIILEESETIQEKLNVFLQNATQEVDDHGLNTQENFKKEQEFQVDEPTVEPPRVNNTRDEEVNDNEVEVEEINEVEVEEIEMQSEDETSDTNCTFKEDIPQAVKDKLEKEEKPHINEEIEKHESHTVYNKDVLDTQAATSTIEPYNVSTFVNNELKEEAVEYEMTEDKDRNNVNEYINNSQETDAVKDAVVSPSVQDLPRSAVLDAVNKLSELAKDIDENTTAFVPGLVIKNDNPPTNSNHFSSFQLIKKDDESELADYPVTNILDETSEKNEASVASMVASTMIVTTPNESSPVIDLNTVHQQVDEGTNDIASHSGMSMELPTDPPSEEEEVPISDHEQTISSGVNYIPTKSASSSDDKPAKNVKKNNKRKQKQKSTRMNKKRKTPITSSQSNSPLRPRPDSARGGNKKAKRGGARGPAKKKK